MRCCCYFVVLFFSLLLESVFLFSFFFWWFVQVGYQFVVFIVVGTAVTFLIKNMLTTTAHHQMSELRFVLLTKKNKNDDAGIFSLSLFLSTNFLYYNKGYARHRRSCDRCCHLYKHIKI